MLKKWLLYTATVSTIAVPVVATVSCADYDAPKKSGIKIVWLDKTKQLNEGVAIDTLDSSETEKTFGQNMMNLFLYPKFTDQKDFFVEEFDVYKHYELNFANGKKMKFDFNHELKNIEVASEIRDLLKADIKTSFLDFLSKNDDVKQSLDTIVKTYGNFKGVEEFIDILDKKVEPTISQNKLVAKIEVNPSLTLKTEIKATGSEKQKIKEVIVQTIPTPSYDVLADYRLSLRYAPWSNPVFPSSIRVENKDDATEYIEVSITKDVLNNHNSGLLGAYNPWDLFSKEAAKQN